jgi:hypothetical protein
MIVVDNGYSVFLNYFIEMSFWNHFPRLLVSILFLYRLMLEGCHFSRSIEVDPYFSLVILLVGVNIWHLHLSFVN